ncbi:14296_t:CDS:2 [Acaulospora colombiana]|uniref:14296_t:CDS:1 n=1 Tax=Acaulospora colombiana TaxID=27376 RepID=A0ACA9LMV9_9GLOM|nr:14296_t:CDS:2 [Acaulospora colombiana]
MKKDIIAIQKKLGINAKANQEAVHQRKEEITLADSYELFLDLVGDMLPIQEELNIEGSPILEVELRSYKASKDISYGEIYNLLLYLEEEIIVIQNELGIIGYSNQERAKTVDENIRAHLKKLEEFHGPLEDDPVVILLKYGEMRIEKIRVTEEGHSLFPNLTPQQLHEILV